jgi:hypothetical protein
VLTSDGLKDPDTTAAALPPIPDCSAEFDSVLGTLATSYGFDARENTVPATSRTEGRG